MIISPPKYLRSLIGFVCTNICPNIYFMEVNNEIQMVSMYIIHIVNMD